MQALKALVIIMGILIIAGMGLLVYGLMTRVSWNEVSGQVEKPLTGQVASFDAVVSTPRRVLASPVFRLKMTAQSCWSSCPMVVQRSACSTWKQGP